MPPDKVYNLDLQTLINFLQDQSALLYTEIDIPDIRGPCHGYVFLKNRTIIGCQIQSQDSVLLLQGQEAYRLLSSKTLWQIRVDPDIDLTLQSMSQQSIQNSPILDTNRAGFLPASYVPRVIGSLEAYLLNGYTSKQRLVLRTVFAMINGDRSVEEIKDQLNLSSEAIDDALNHMKSIDVIE
ncbi:MAG: hypothetical protein JO011_12010 [Ktedonobacteraceae bacterium]|nr:hypothetical protein [Ktedonobacteraceae bacterium]MBV9711619.1 hypothetical protein [Ktedonobacteraceae bacterium]